jgi:hypothetical protein
VDKKKTSDDTAQEVAMAPDANPTRSNPKIEG